MTDENLDLPRVSGFEFLRKLGAGGMGEVFLARETRSASLVAIKFAGHDASTPEDRARFERETRLLEGLSHPRIVGVRGHGTIATRDFLVMDFVAGRTLRERLDSTSDPLELRDTAALVADLAEALDFLHARAIVHRDLKPENVLLDRDGRALLSDFGVSAPIAELGQITHSGSFVGTIDYMAPEQRLRLPVDARADQFSLAVIAYEALTRRRPLGRFRLPSELGARVSVDVDAAIAKALEEDPDDRFGSVREFANALESALETPARRRIARWRQSTIALVLGCVAVLVAATLAIDYLERGLGESPLGGVDRIAAIANSAGERDNAAVSQTVLITAPRIDGEPVLPNVAYYTKLAESHVAADRFVEATLALDEAIRLDPQCPALFLQRALVHKSHSMHQSALEDLEAALRLDPKLVDAYIGAGSIYARLKDYARAVAALDEAVRLDPRAATAFAWRGWAHHGLEDDDKARADLECAIELDADCGVAYQFRGILAKLRRDYAQAKSDYANFARCEPDDPFAHRTLASLLALCPAIELRDGALAVEHARRACEITNWSSWAGLRTLASSHAQNGDFAAAVRWCEAALEHAPENRRAEIGSQAERYRRDLLAAGVEPPR